MADLRRKKEKTFCAFLTAGFPDLKKTAEYAAGFERAGVDILELGFPFSDPLADGPTIQYSSEKALEKGVTIESVFQLLGGLRKQGLRLPVIFFSYFNPILAYGTKHFARRAVRAGFDGVLVPDLPPEEEPFFQRECRKQGLSRVLLIAPTTSKERARALAARSEGFIYYVSLRGVTGARSRIPKDIHTHLTSLKKMTKKPLLIGFGISTPEQASHVAALSDGAIVGSAIVDRIRKSGGSAGPVLKYIRQMVRAVKRQSPGF